MIRMALSSKEHLAFVRYCINEQQCVPTVTDWHALFAFMQEQALLGVGFRGIERMKEAGVEIPRNVLLKWYAISEQIRQRNVEMNKRCVELTEMLKKDGFESCILKGQGNAVNYQLGVRNEELGMEDEQNEGKLALLRQPGDIDIFLLPKGCLSISERRKVVMEYVRSKFPEAKIRYQHIDFPIHKGVDVEMHFIPTAKNNPLYNYRIQQWVEERIAEQCQHFVVLPNTNETNGTDGMVCVPTLEFNIIYQLSHLMHHFFDEGVGLRQMMDYYYLLRKAKDDNGQQTTDNGGLKAKNDNRPQTTDNGELTATLKYLNLYQFAGAVMWVLHEVFGLEEDYYIAPPDEWRGKLLLDEILKGGNFGHYSGLTNHSTGTKYFLKIKRNMRFVRAYPAEALCEPLFRTWHFFWRLFHR